MQCKCGQSKCNNPDLPHFGKCIGCYVNPLTPKERREFWKILSQHFNKGKL